MDHQRKSLSPRGFTLIEILVVVAIIAILIAMAVLGFGALFRGQERELTKKTLANTQSMFAELDRITTLKRQPPHMWRSNGPLYDAGAMDIWRDADPVTAGTQGLATPGPVDEYSPGRTGAAVKNTQLVMAEILKVPETKNMIAQIPPEQLFKLPDDVATMGWDESNPPTLLDAWNNPIILVPASGLRDLSLADSVAPNLYVITSTKTYKVADLPNGTTATLVPGARPFFASAGPDGDFTKGDDNLYSFQN